MDQCPASDDGEEISCSGWILRTWPGIVPTTDSWPQGIPHSVTLTLDLHLKYLILIPDSLVAFGEHGVQQEFRTELNNLLKVLGFGVNVGRLTAGPWATCKLPDGQPMATNSWALRNQTQIPKQRTCSPLPEPSLHSAQVSSLFFGWKPPSFFFFF